jgi:putative addiction module killer protein
MHNILLISYRKIKNMKLLKYIEFEKSSDYELWLVSLTEKEKAQVKARIDRIRISSHFGDWEILGGGLCELRWRNGWRVYFAWKKGTNIIVLLGGGHKNGQEKDIKKARAKIR